MNPPVLSVQLRVGTTAAAPRSMRITVDHIAVRVKKYFRRVGFTLIRAKGAYKGKAEASAIIECFFVPERHTRPEDVYDFCEHVHKFMKEIFHELAQRQIIVSVSLGDGARDIRWSRATSWDGSLIDRPFLHPSLVAAHMVPEADFALPILSGLVATHYSDIGCNDACESFDRVPEICFVPGSAMCFTFDGTINLGALDEWDREILVEEGNLAANASDFSSEGEFISLFRSVSQRPVYTASKISSLRSQTRVFAPIQVTRCPYDLGTGFAEGLYLNALDEWLRVRRNCKKFRRYLSRERTLARLDNSPLSMIGISVLFTPEDKVVLLKKRGRRTAAYPGMDQTAPSGMVEPFPDHGYPSVALTFLRELDEELFGAPEVHETKERLLSKEHIKTLKGRLQFLGAGIDLMRHDIDIFLQFTPDDVDWWERYKRIVRLNWEYSSSVPEYQSLAKINVRANESPGEFVPGTVAALRLREKTLRVQQ